MLKIKKFLDPILSHLDPKQESFNQETVLNKARTIIKDYKNNPAYIEFWSLVEVLDMSMMRYLEQHSQETLTEINDVVFEIYLIELYQAGDKKYYLLKECVEEAIGGGSKDVAHYKKYREKFLRIEQEYVG